MKTNSVLLLIILLASSAYSSTDSTEAVNWKTFDSGMLLAKGADKKVMVDVYTDWCGWCKRMDSQTYGDAKIASYLNERFVSIKLNAEGDDRIIYRNRQYTSRELASAFGVSGSPTTLFLQPNGEPITKYPCFADPAFFNDIIRYIADDHYLNKDFTEFRKLP